MAGVINGKLRSQMMSDNTAKRTCRNCERLWRCLKEGGRHEDEYHDTYCTEWEAAVFRICPNCVKYLTCGRAAKYRHDPELLNGCPSYDPRYESPPPPKTRTLVTGCRSCARVWDCDSSGVTEPKAGCDNWELMDE